MHKTFKIVQNEPIFTIDNKVSYFYMTSEIWPGGFNKIRSVLLFAHKNE